MIDEKLARGYARQFLRDIEQPAVAAAKAIDKLYENFTPNRKGQMRQLTRLQKSHKNIITDIIPVRKGGKSDTVILYWSRMSFDVNETDYAEANTLSSIITVLHTTRRAIDILTSCGPLSLSHHALQRWIERDNTLPNYDMTSWLQHLQPALNIAFILRWAADDSEDLDQYLYRPVALPTWNGLFVSFLVLANGPAGDLQWQAAARSFYGPHELDDDLQRLHARLLDVAQGEISTTGEEEVIAAHETYGWDRLWSGQESALLKALKK